MKISKNFTIQEFVPPSVYKRYGENSIWFVNPVVINLAQFYKDFFSKHFQEPVYVQINDWSYGGIRKWSGLRTFAYIWELIKKGKNPARLSQHIGGMCNAFDCKIYFKRKGKRVYIEPDMIRNIILENEKKFMAKGLTTLESGKIAKTWIHSDCRNTNSDKILIVGK